MMEHAIEAMVVEALIEIEADEMIEELEEQNIRLVFSISDWLLQTGPWLVEILEPKIKLENHLRKEQQTEMGIHNRKF